MFGNFTVETLVFARSCA